MLKENHNEEGEEQRGWGIMRKTTKRSGYYGLAACKPLWVI